MSGSILGRGGHGLFLDGGVQEEDMQSYKAGKYKVAGEWDGEEGREPGIESLRSLSQWFGLCLWAVGSFQNEFHITE